MTEHRYYARSASDRTDDWPLWFVADHARGGQNVTSELIREHLGSEAAAPGAVLLSAPEAKVLAEIANDPEKFERMKKEEDDE